MDTSVANEENTYKILTRPFQCGFCSAKQAIEVSKQLSSQTPTGAFHADALAHYGRRDNLRISGVVEEHNEDV